MSTKPTEFCSLIHVNAYRNSIKNLYRERMAPIDADLECVFQDTMSAYKRRIADLKSKGEMSIHEGKQPMSQFGYHYLVEAAVKQNDDFNFYVTCHCFLLLCWNLIARAVSVGSILYDSISWEEDAMTIHIGKMKNDQEGTNGFARHVYANPKDPVICPISYYPLTFRVALPRLLASLVYHQDWLKNKLPFTHPLFQQRVWTSGIMGD